ncbi:ribonuclease HIII [Mycoplasma iguanae]|uniref:Ribonuclease n=1 Tax=Mycoplasma iguanae TaxID=292461 RepID=A0ABY5R9C5_9MOLU|nr:ribonuclease HIII [Mycoplasma iguanae]UVD81926.1 ribonuclease HIII [Mycoplasma iguanae]
MLNKIDQLKIIGADETGVGDYFTPLVACAVYLKPENYAKVQALNLRDSKTLTETRILELAQQLTEIVVFETTIFKQQLYNKLEKKYNANEIKMLIHLKNINTLEKKHVVDFIIIDQFSTEKSINKYYQRIIGESQKNFLPLQAKLILETKAENTYLAVAAAAIIARATLLEYMKKQNKKWNINFPLGASSIVDDFGKEFVKIHGKEKLVEVAKISFKTTEKILNN